ncbi:DNA-binding transcriptional regulator, AcrR family [Actinopolymorpha cephalotaxi]|uniref:AcrR family transcriptional regulator n=1 Tax=Actinopolymorpha cephalotaxi TaxID=504797 RepID=A0A1I3AGU6_9ACTN|nr:TetR/AcrR family transcriptional regulator [Actinopolymorpha cephalotaxi]NYH82138.1 AcrR family transcriptional regulator [Actinopolymorpha cephalotaxi]SFH49282.1 DNA-binding transcriptional regulator, AcrR family [Actinopolymorpha cephalotaxi]
MSYRKKIEGGRSSPGRPRDEGLERRILAAVLEVLSEAGYAGLTYEEVARRCNASKASLYRRWKTKRDMVIAALRSGPAQDGAAEPIDTGSLREDLLCLCRRLDRTMRAADSQTAMLLLQAGLEDPELCEAIENSVGPTGARLPRQVLDAAVARGDLPAGTDPFAFEEVVGAALLLRRINGLPAGEEYLVALVDTIVIPALRASATSPVPLPAGIFSGHPGPPVPDTLPPATKENR